MSNRTHVPCPMGRKRSWQKPGGRGIFDFVDLRLGPNGTREILLFRAGKHSIRGIGVVLFPTREKIFCFRELQVAGAASTGFPYAA